MEKNSQEKSWEANAIVLIALDKMSATLNLPAPEDEETYTAEEVIDFVKRRGIKQGIDVAAIQKMITQQLYYMDVCIANGKEAVQGTDGSYDFGFRMERTITPRELPDGTVDYLNMDLFEMVKKGQKLAQYTEATKGQFGFTVTGDLLIPRNGRDLKPLRGSGFVVSQDRKNYYAAFDGKVIYENERLEVSRVLLIAENVDMSTGNLNFDGDIFIKGDVIAGLRVEATGDIQICGHVESAYLECGGNLIVKKGMQGGGHGYILADGDVMGSFFEAVEIQAKGDIHANYFMNCTVSTHETVTAMGRKGAIIGGKVQGLKGISAYTFGNKAELSTVLECGISKDNMDHYNELRKDLAKIDSEIRIFEEGKVKFESKLSMAMLETHGVYSKILQAIQIKKKEKQDCMKQMQDLLQKLSSDNEIRVTARGTVNAGVSVIIDTYELKLNKEITGVYFIRKENHIAMYKI